MKKQMTKTLAIVLITGLCANSAQAGIWESISQFSKETQTKLFAGAAIVSSLSGLRLGYKMYQKYSNKKAHKEACENLAEIVTSLKARNEADAIESDAIQILHTRFHAGRPRRSDNFTHNYRKVTEQIKEVERDTKPFNKKANKPSYASVLSGQNFSNKKVNKEACENLAEIVASLKARNEVDIVNR